MSSRGRAGGASEGSLQGSWGVIRLWWAGDATRQGATRVLPFRRESRPRVLISPVEILHPLGQQRMTWGGVFYVDAPGWEAGDPNS